MSRSLLKLINESARGLPANKRFCNDLMKAIEQVDMSKGYKGSNYYKPSSLHCMRQMYFIRKNAEQDTSYPDYQLVGMAGTGTARHESIQDVLIKMKDLGYDWEYMDVGEYVKKKQDNGELLQLKVKGTKGHETHLIDENLKLSFRVDGLLKRLSTEEYFLFEFKNVVSFKYNRINKKALDEHLQQVTCYCACLGLDKAFITYENRDLCELDVPEIVNVTDEMKNDIISYLTECEEMVLNNTVPYKVENEKYCRYCLYKNICKKYD